jgi:hypothetical protein
MILRGEEFNLIKRTNSEPKESTKITIFEKLKENKLIFGNSDIFSLDLIDS